MKVGELIQAQVVEVKPHGVSLKACGRDGFIQIPELSWDEFGLGSRLSDICGPGDQLFVMILSVSDSMFYASLKRARPECDPWNEHNRPSVGQICQGEVALVADYGRLVKLPTYAMGLLPRSDASDSIEVGDNILVRVSEVNERKQQVSVELAQEHSGEVTGE